MAEGGDRSGIPLFDRVLVDAECGTDGAVRHLQCGHRRNVGSGTQGPEEEGTGAPGTAIDSPATTGTTADRSADRSLQQRTAHPITPDDNNYRPEHQHQHQHQQ